jgi:DNA adenine methylase
MNSPIKWHGGKHYLAKQIVEMMPRHLHYVEPYFGSGAVLLARDPEDKRLWWSEASHERGVSEVVGDIDGGLTNFWDVLQDDRWFQEFFRRVQATPFSEIEWRRAEGTELAGVAGELDRAVAFFVRCRHSLAGRMDSFALITRNRTRRKMNEQASAWLSAIEGLPEVHDRLKRVVILNQDALEVIRKQDGPKTLFYLDPPYLHETRSAKEVYLHEMSRQDHWNLCNYLARIMGKFILSGYRNEMYDDFAHDYGWHRIDFDLPNHAAGGDEKRRMTECVWTNYQPEPA